MVFCAMTTTLLGQGKSYDGPDDPAGDIAAEREGYMTGNRVFLYFRNTTELSDWPKVEVSKWPNTYEGVKMTDGIGLLIGAMVYITEDSIPVTDPDQVEALSDQDKIDTLYYLQTSYREHMDTDPTGTIEWGLYPVFGYFNENSEYPAMSNLPDSWPINGWPASGDDRRWIGEWDGRFGRGVIYADLETYFVDNDAQDQEYLGPEDRVKYYPRPGVKIGDKFPSVTIQKGAPWGGIGIRVQQRGFQWNNPQARDAIFWEYTIANISDYNLKDVAFGYWVDNAIGNDADDELGYFDRKQDLAYSWDIDGIGRGGYPTGLMGFAYLESPGIGNDGDDNDEDGLTDEKRDNQAVALIGAYDGITNLADFLETYNLSTEDLKEHWDADEDQDWQDGTDLNGDGQYQTNEDPGDDVGLDGVGPAELNYGGPDEGECNHRPDYSEGYGCEPNFAATDVTESDMVGLTSFMLFPIQPERPPYYRWFRNDQSMWEVIGHDTLVEYLGNISNLVETFASGPFTLHRGRTERISMSELHSYDPLEGLNRENNYSCPALFQQKRIVQIIYERDYRFAQPPKMPTLSATPGDGRVILSWDDAADKKTRDPFIGENDFEGYKLFRATDKKMEDSEVITDGFGTPMFKKPIFECDLVDSITGFTDFGLVNGMGYYLGRDSGIRHFFIDENVINGCTYYYALVAYDYGAPDVGPGIAPSENNVIIELDEAEEVRNISRNVQIVTPYQQAAGYVPDEIVLLDEQQILGTGTVSAEILATHSLKPGHKYQTVFSLDSIYVVPDYKHGMLYSNNGIQVYDDNDKFLVYEENPSDFVGQNLLYDDSLDYYYLNNIRQIFTDIFDGFRLNIDQRNQTASYDFANSGWKKGNSPIQVIPTVKESKYFPWDYDIIFYDRSAQVYTGRASSLRPRDESGHAIRSNVLNSESFSFEVINKSFTDSTGEYEKLDLIVHDLNGNLKYDMLEDRVLAGPVDKNGNWAGTAFIFDFSFARGDSSSLPAAGDIYHVTFKRPFWSTDTLTFLVNRPDSVDRDDLKFKMGNIKVVPNPYVATNVMEPSVANWYLNQRRNLMFINLPAECTIKIFTVSGVLVDVMNVENAADNGTYHWDMLTKENLEIAPGVYIFHVQSKTTKDEMVGKFAVIK